MGELVILERELEREFNRIKGIVSIGYSFETYLVTTIEDVVKQIEMEFKKDGVISNERASRQMIMKMDYVMTMCDKVTRGEVSQSKANSLLQDLQLNRINLEIMPRPNTLAAYTVSSSVISYQLSVFYNAVMGLILFMTSNSLKFLPILAGGDAYSEQRSDIAHILSSSFAGKAVLLWNELTVNPIHSLKLIYKTLTTTIGYEDYSKVYGNIESMLDIKQKAIPDVTTPVSNGFLSGLMTTVVDKASKVATGAKRLVYGDMESAFVEQLRGQVNAADILVTGAARIIFYMTLLIIVMWVIYWVVGKVAYARARSRVDSRIDAIDSARQQQPAIDLSFNFADIFKTKSKRKSPTKKQTTKLKSPSKKQVKKGKCKSPIKKQVKKSKRKSPTKKQTTTKSKL